MVFEMKLDQEPFEKILCGEKTVELRLFDCKRRSVNIDDDIIVINSSNENRKFAVTVTSLYRYRTFEDLFSEINPTKCRFDSGVSIEETAEAMEMYYTSEEIKTYGVIGIKIKLKSLNEVIKRKEIEAEFEYNRLFLDGMK